MSFDLTPKATDSAAIVSGALLLAAPAIHLIADRLVEARFGGESSGNPMGIVGGAILDGIREPLIFGIGMGPAVCCGESRAMRTRCALGSRPRGTSVASPGHLMPRFPSSFLLLHPRVKVRW